MVQRFVLIALSCLVAGCSSAVGVVSVDRQEAAAAYEAELQTLQEIESELRRMSSTPGVPNPARKSLYTNWQVQTQKVAAAKRRLEKLMRK